MVTYDPAILVVFASRLYAQAQRVVIMATLIGVLLGGVGGAAGCAAAGFSSDISIGMIAGALLLGLFGFVVGLERAFMYKLKAQETLCILQTEINTRTEATVAAMAHGVPPGAAPARGP